MGRRALFGILIGVGALLAACSSSATPDTPTTNADGFTAYVTYLQRNGVTLPSGLGQPPGGNGGTPGAFSPGAAPGGNFGPGGGGFGPGGGAGGGLFGTQAPTGVDQATWTKAMQACASVRPTDGPSGGAGNNSAFAAYRYCLSQHGVDLTGGQVNTADPTYVAAERACAALRPSQGPRPSASAGS